MAGSLVLLVEDDHDTREFVTTVLESQGFEVVESSNGRDALAYLRRATQLPCAIVLDLMMPIMDGWAFLRERAKDSRLITVPVVVTSADPKREHTSLLGVVAVVDKPFHPMTLVRLLKAIARSGSMEDEGGAL